MIDLILRVLEFAAPILAMMAFGLFGAGVLTELGLMRSLARIARPIFSFTRLPDACASAFVVSLGSAVAANGMVARFRDEGCLEEKEVVLCAVMNSIPVYVRELFTYQIPIVIPALGLVVGGFYALVFIITALVKISVVVVLSRLFLDEGSCRVPEKTQQGRVSLKEAVIRAFRRERRLFFKIAAIYITMTTLVFALRDREAFEAFSVLPLAELFGIPPESIVPLTTYVASPIVGISLLGPMIASDGISHIQAMIVLMLGSMFMLPFFAARSLLPRYIGLFGPRLGVGIVVFSTGMSILVRFSILVILLVFGR
ncbi:nucleoside recognition protein [Methanocrinis sp.]|uniref:nucleoside recognition protein n=1 Tax=Methanocrinis sp. TaxID=3101522 RepID=UPI003D12668A